MRRAIINYTRVLATDAEVEEFKKKHNGFHPGIYRLKCKTCGKRIWGSGLGVGSHNRACSRAAKREMEEASR